MPKGLVLTRKEGEAIMIGQEIKITILDVGRNSVRFQLVAPDYVEIVRVGGKNEEGTPGDAEWEETDDD